MATNSSTDNWECVSNNVKEFILPAGKYHIGDLYYCMADSVYFGVWANNFNFKDGVYRRKSDGAMFAVRNVGEDGECRGSDRTLFNVYAGHIGIALVSLCDGSPEHMNCYTLSDDVMCKFTPECYSVRDSLNRGVDIELKYANWL